MAQSGTRVLFYSHDTFGLGHIRRTLAISGTVARTLRDASVLVATGSSLLPSLRLPPAVDYVKLPCVSKVGHERYEARTLGLEFETIRSLREAILFATATSFAPHLLFVDNVPLGMKGEMTRTLRHIRAHCPDTRVILTLRDVLDDPERIVRTWTAESTYEAIDRFYDRVMVYGAPEIFDVVREYRFPQAVARKVEYAGYIRSTASQTVVRQTRHRLTPRGERLVLVTVGGGADGQLVVDHYLRGVAAIHGTVPTQTVVVLGPDMPDDARQKLHAHSAGDPRVTFTDFRPDLPTYLAAADVVVSMGGYNTVCEILSFGTPAVIIPRVEPRLEQWIRCRRLADLGFVTTIHPGEVTPERLTDEVLRMLTANAPARPDVSLNFNGLRAVSDVVRHYTRYSMGGWCRSLARKTMWSVVAFLAVLMGAAASGVAQTNTPVTGIAEDQTEAIVPGALAILINRATGEVRQTYADKTGRFTFEVPPGDYSLLARAEDLESPETAVTIGTTPLEIRLRLRVGLEERVTVTAGHQDALAPDDNATAVAFDESLFRQLPTDSENLLPLVTAFLAPAALGADGVSIIIDGLETNQLDVPAWAIKDLLVNSNPFSAAYQRPGTSRIEVTTKQASRRRFRGSLALSDRNSVLDARDAFSIDKPHLDRRLVDAGLSGPLPFDHASFFVNGSHLADHGTAIVNARTLAGALVQNVPTDHEKTNVVVRADGRPASLNTVTAFYTFTDNSQTAQGVGGFTLAEHGAVSTERDHRLRVADQAVLSTRLSNLAQMSIESDDRRTGALAPSPALVVNGAFTGGPSGAFRHDRDLAFELLDSAVYTRGVHTLHVGARVRPKVLRTDDQSNGAGTFRFAGLTSFSTGTPFAFQINQGRTDVSFDDTRASVYGQDELRPRRDLSVLIGLRYDWQSLIDDRLNVAPRLALAYAPGTQRTVVRAGLGLFSDRMPDAVRRRALLFGGERIRQVLVVDPPYPNASDVIGTMPPSVTRLDANLHTPETVDASLSIEHAVGNGTWITASVDRLREYRLFRSRDINAPLPETGVRPNPAFVNINQIESSAEQLSHALTLTLRGHIGKVVRGTAQYRLSKTTNDTSGPFVLPADSYNLAAEEGRADFDRRHQLNVTGSISLPRAFRIGVVLALASGVPYDITTGSDDNHDGIANDRPLGITRNTGRGPGLAQVDMRISRLFRVPSPVRRERPPRNLDLNLDAFNVLNHGNFPNFVGVQTSPFFGRPNAALAPRTLQLSMAYHF